MRIIDTAYISLGLLLCACSHEHSGLETDDMISISVRESTEITARSVSPYQSTNAKIYLYYKEVNSLTNATYKYNGILGKWDSDSPLAWSGINKIGTVYPFYAVAPQVLANAAGGEVLHDQSGTDGSIPDFEKSDLLMAYSTSTVKTSELALTLQHLLAQLRIVFLSGETEITPTVLQSVSCKISGAKTAYDIAYPAPTLDVPAVTTASGAVASDIIPFGQADATYTLLHNAILPPQSIAVGDFSIAISSEIDGETRTAVWRNTAQVNLVAGQCTVIKLNLYSREELKLGDISVNPWNETDVTGDFGY